MRAKIVKMGDKYKIIPATPGEITPVKPGEPALKPTQPVVRFRTANPEILFHTVRLSEMLGARIYNFFTVYPDPNRLNGNFGQPYIRRNMILQAIKIDYLPASLTSHITNDPATTYDFRTAFNALDKGFVRIKINKATWFEYSLQDLAPDITTDAELISATGPVFNLYHKVIPSKFTPFKDLIGLESQFITERDEVYVELELPEALTVQETKEGEVSNTLHIRVSLLARPERQPYIG